MNSIDILRVSQILVVIGWFWVIVYTIFRAENFKKRYFLTLVVIYFTQGVMRVAELLMFERDVTSVTPMAVLSNLLCIIGFAFLTNRYIKFKIYFDEKTINFGSVNHNVLRGEKSE